MTMQKTLIALMSLLTLSGCATKTATPLYPTDTITAHDGSQFSITFFKHASLALEVAGKHIYIDPVSSFADYTKLPKADAILITHSHSDHLDTAAIRTLSKPGTQILADSTSAAQIGSECRTLRPGDTAQVDNIGLDAVAAYNTTPDRLQFHPRERKDCGYVLTINGTRVYIAGDSEPTPEMEALTDIDIAFLPVNQPYTMTVEQAVAAVNAIRPAVFYPYHYGEVEVKTDIDRLVNELQGVTEVRVRPME